MKLFTLTESKWIIDGSGDGRCTFEEMPGGSARVVLEGDDQGLAAGQYACFYQNGICLGSAVIQGQS